VVETGRDRVNNTARQLCEWLSIIIIIIIRNLYSDLMPLGGYRGAGRDTRYFQRFFIGKREVFVVKW